MKYFINYPYTLETLKKEFRAHCLNLHPDHGGDEEQFKNMMAEYYKVLQDLTGTHSTNEDKEEHRRTAEDYARQYAEEQARREEEERERREYEAEERARKAQEEEKKRKMQEAMAAAVRAWSGILERVDTTATGRARYYNFSDKKEAAAFVATTKRNIQKVVNTYFKDLKIKVSLSGACWKEKFEIAWQDGPTANELRQTCKELAFFIPVHYESDPYSDYGDHVRNEYNALWREAYGQALGDTTDFETSRTLSEEGRAQAEQLAAQHFANFDPTSEAPTFIGSLAELSNFAKAAGFDGENLNNIFNFLTNDWTAKAGYWSEIKGNIKRHQLNIIFNKYVHVDVKPAPKAPEFVPTYGPTYKAIKKALNGNIFSIKKEINGKEKEIELSIFQAAEYLANGEHVKIGRAWSFEGSPRISGVEVGGPKSHDKRRAKFAAVGVILEGYTRIYATVTATSIAPDVFDALQDEAADINRQRANWEAMQAKADTTTDTTTDTDTTTADEAPADGLTLEEIPGGVAVTGDSRTTFRNRKAIKAHGATWNKAAQQWQALNPDDVARLRAWFLLRKEQPQADTATPDPEQLENGQLFDLFESLISSAVGYLGADFSRAPVEDWKLGYYYNNGKINDLFKAFKLGRTANQ